MTEDPKSQKMIDIGCQITQLTDVMHSNINRAIARSEKLSDLQDKSERLEEHSILFDHDARRLKNRQRLKYIRRSVALFLIVLIIILIIILSLKPWTW